MYPDCRRARSTASARFAVSLQSVLQENVSCTCWVEHRGGGCEGSSGGEMPMEAASCFHKFVSDFVAWFAYVSGDPGDDGGAFHVV